MSFTIPFEGDSSSAEAKVWREVEQFRDEKLALNTAMSENDPYYSDTPEFWLDLRHKEEIWRRAGDAEVPLDLPAPLPDDMFVAMEGLRKAHPSAEDKAWDDFDPQTMLPVDEWEI